MSMKTLLQSLLLALVLWGLLVIGGSIEATAWVASYIGYPGAWLGVSLFGGGHNDLTGMLVGEYLFFTAVSFFAIAIIRRLRRKTGT